MPYAPEAVDLIWADLDPDVGREQSGRRPALVVPPAEFCRVTEFAIDCPITSRVRPFGTSVVQPLGVPVSVEILTSHVRGIDTLAGCGGPAIRHSDAVVTEAPFRIGFNQGIPRRATSAAPMHRPTAWRPDRDNPVLARSAAVRARTGFRGRRVHCAPRRH